MLAVVDDQKETAQAEVAGDHVVEVGPIKGAQAPQVCDRGRHEIRIGDRGKLCEPCSVGEFGEVSRSRLDGQARLARPARPDQRHEPVLVQQCRDRGEVRCTADERRRVAPKVGRRFDGSPQRREPSGQAGRHDLVDLERCQQVLEPMRAHRPERDPVGEISSRQRVGRR